MIRQELSNLIKFQEVESRGQKRGPSPYNFGLPSSQNQGYRDIRACTGTQRARVRCLEDSYTVFRSVPTAGVRQVASAGLRAASSSPLPFFTPRNRCKPRREKSRAAPPRPHIFGIRMLHGACVFVERNATPALYLYSPTFRYSSRFTKATPHR